MQNDEMVEMVETVVDELVELDDNLEIDDVVEIDDVLQFDILVLFCSEQLMFQNDYEVVNEFRMLVDELLEQIEQIDKIDFWDSVKYFSL